MRWSQDRQRGRIRTTENLADIHASLSIAIGDIGAVAHQTTGLDEFPQKIDRGNLVMCSQPNELVALPEQKRVCGDNQRVSILLDEGCEGRVDFTFRAGVQNISP